MAIAERGSFAAALRGAEFRALWLAEALSVAGDRLAWVALALLVHGRTNSASLLPEGQYQAGLGLRQISTQTARVIGFGLGGTLVTAIGAAGALVLNGGTFLVSALVIVLFVLVRQPSTTEPKRPAKPCRSTALTVGWLRRSSSRLSSGCWWFPRSWPLRLRARPGRPPSRSAC